LCISAPITVDPQHPPTAEETKLAAVVEFQTRQAVAKETGTRVAGATVGELAKKAGVGERQFRRLSAQFGSRSLSRRPGSGRPDTVNAKDIEQWFRQKSRSLNGFWTAESMAIEMRAQWGLGSSATVSRMARKLGYRQLFQCYRPALTATHQERRLDWATKVLAQPHPFAEPDTVYVHVDEKWFFAQLLKRRCWVGPREKPPVVTLASKTHITKVMFLGAVARPNPTHNFDGRIGLYPIADQVPAQRKSKHHNKGRPSLEAGQHGRKFVQEIHDGTCG
jgi:transposase